MKTKSETNRQLDLKLSNKGYRIAVAFMLVIVSSLLVGYYLVSVLSPPEGYSRIDVLNYQTKKAVDYPDLLVINQNNTFSVWVEVENRMGSQLSCQVQQKVVSGSVLEFPVETSSEENYTRTLENGEIWEIPASVSINDPGSYSVVFELWIYDNHAEAFEFSYNYCVLPIDVVNQT